LYKGFRYRISRSL